MILLPVLALSASLVLPIANAAPDGAPPTKVIAHIKWCQRDDPKVCREEELVPAEDRTASNILDCMRGLMMLSSEFTLDGVVWQTRGGHCEEESSAWIDWKLKDHAQRAARAAP